MTLNMTAVMLKVTAVMFEVTVVMFEVTRVMFESCRLTHGEHDNFVQKKTFSSRAEG